MSKILNIDKLKKKKYYHTNIKFLVHIIVRSIVIINLNKVA